MEHANGPMHTMSPEECWEFLATTTLGRIVTNVRDQIDIVPVNYYADGSSILFRTAPGNKLVELTINDQVVFEVDGVDEIRGWSVVIKGTAHALELEAEIEAAEALPLFPMAPTIKHVYVRITPHKITGVRFIRGPEPTPLPEP